MSFQHKELANGRWNTFSFFEQMANIGSEVERTISWSKKDARYSQMALDRAIELIDLTLADPKNRKRLFEIARIREVLLDYFLCGNHYGYSDIIWQNYFYNFAYANALDKHL